MSDEYDVVIIGSGAGGGTLAHRLSTTGKRVLILERGDWLPREIENWDAQAVFVDNRYVSADTWYDGGGHGVPAADPLLRRRRDQVLRRRALPAARARLPELEHHGGVSPAWPVGYDVMEPYYTQAEQLYQVHGEPRRGLDRPVVQRAVPLPAGGRTRRACSSCTTTCREGRAAPVPLPVRDHARRGGHGLQRLHPLRHLRRLPVPGARQVRRGRRSRCGRRSSTTT